MSRTVERVVIGIAFLSAIRIVTAGETSTLTTPAVVLTGADSHIIARSYHRITSLPDWIKLWRQHKGDRSSEEYSLYYDPLGLPLVDFRRYVLIAIFQGSGWNSAGLTIHSISEERDRNVLRFDDKSYQTAGPDGGARRAAVYGFFLLPRSSKPIILEENVQGLLGKPPIWKERATFPRI